jgi:glutaredoxin
VERFWEIEYIKDLDEILLSNEDQRAEKMLKENYVKLPDGRVQLPCLWKPGQPDIKSSYDTAKKKLYSLLNSKLMGG